MLERELEASPVIAGSLRQFPLTPLLPDWQQQVAKTFGLQVNTLYNCFFDIDGELLLERPINLTRLGPHRSFLILLQ